MSLQLSETLKALLTERKKETLKKGWGDIPNWVFTSVTGTIMDPIISDIVCGRSY